MITAGGMNGSIVYELDRPENAGLKKPMKACSLSLSLTHTPLLLSYIIFTLYAEIYFYMSVSIHLLVTFHEKFFVLNCLNVNIKRN
jgi:hypothetical protein